MAESRTKGSYRRGNSEARLGNPPGLSELLLVEVVSEGPHCVPCEYAIAAVEYVSDRYAGRIIVRIVETKHKADALRYLELARANGGRLPVPAILFDGRLVFDSIPGPEELTDALDRALETREPSP